MIAWTLFVNPIAMPPGSILWLCIPLCVSVAAIYRTLRVERLAGVWWRILVLTAEIVGGLFALAVVLWLILAYLMN
ncbi:hypothetical protein LCGC14_0284050 [marine sediment metagenome]|uniref:Uncharacterized protein n=1 Tax=marine sediment metagenome TaxID=412755 RepID=A0A0F9TV32_9ZZZZ|nr:hypothetical protein [Phycisphaerae bacterium]HDZ43954.1 hypothetical protein [Phycisphaerae bacterium]